MDFGSALPARIPIPNRSVALTQQDLAAEHCSMPFRAPELFDVRPYISPPCTQTHSEPAQVKTNLDLTEAVDIWSLGCTLFAMAYGTSPFETTQQSEHGGSIAMAVLNGKYAFPGDGTYSEGFKEIVKMCLVVKPEERPDINQVRGLLGAARAGADGYGWSRSSTRQKRPWRGSSNGTGLACWNLTDSAAYKAVSSQLRPSPLLLAPPLHSHRLSLQQPPHEVRLNLQRPRNPDHIARTRADRVRHRGRRAEPARGGEHRAGEQRFQLAGVGGEVSVGAKARSKRGRGIRGNGASGLMRR